MSEKRSSPVIGLLVLIGVLLLGFVGVGYAMGWIQFSDTSERTTIEFDKKAASEDAEYAVEQTEDLIEQARDTWQGSDDAEDDSQAAAADKAADGEADQARQNMAPDPSSS